MYFAKRGLRCQYQKSRVDATNATYLGSTFYHKVLTEAVCMMILSFPPRNAAPAALRTGTTSSSLAYPFFVSASWGLQGRGVTKLELGNERK